jgi:D-3-phosphoglycerate dehydrogenase
MRILIADPIASEGIELLRTHAEVDVRTGLKPEELVGIVGDYDALVVRSETEVSAEVIAAGEKLQVIGRAGVGVDNIDVEAATRQGIVVVNAPLGNVVSAAEHSIALMLALARNIPQGHLRLKTGEWHRNDLLGAEIRGKVLGIVGLGRVGSEVARRAKGLEMQVIIHDPFVSPEYARNLGVELVSWEELFQQADFITVHTPLTEATKGFVGERELSWVKPSVRFINTARGGLIDEEALFQALEDGRVAGAAIDVFSKEPTTDNILLRSDKVIVTPHLGASTAEAQRNVAVDVAEQVLAVLQGQPVRYAVNSPLIPPETLSIIAPFLSVATEVGRLVAQLVEGQMETIAIKYDGEIADYDTNALRATVIGGLLEHSSEERVNVVNASIIAQSRGLKVVEQKSTVCPSFGNLITVEVSTSAGMTIVAGTVMRGGVHIVRVGDFWFDIVPTGGYWLFIDHRDRPGFIGAVGMVTGEAGININTMHVSRLKPRGQALMALGLDEPLSERDRQRILDIADVYAVKAVTL